MNSPVTLRPEQFAVMRAIKRGEPHTLYPMMRRALRRHGLIIPTNGAPPPAERRHAKEPKREFAITPEGERAMEAYTGPMPHPNARPVCLKIAVHRNDPNDIIASVAPRRRAR